MEKSPGFHGSDLEAAAAIPPRTSATTQRAPCVPTSMPMKSIRFASNLRLMEIRCHYNNFAPGCKERNLHEGINGKTTPSALTAGRAACYNVAIRTEFTKPAPHRLRSAARDF